MPTREHLLAVAEQSPRIGHKLGAAALSLALVAGSPPQPIEKSITEGNIAEQPESDISEKLLSLLEAEVIKATEQGELMADKQLDLHWFPEGITKYSAEFEKVGKEYDIDPNVLGVIAWLETKGGELNVTSSAGAEGYMQIMPDTAQAAIEQFDVASYDPWDNVQSIAMSARVISMHQEWLKGAFPEVNPEMLQKPKVILASYNGGPGAAQDYIMSNFDPSVLPSETQNYVEFGTSYLAGETPEELLP